MTLNAYRLFSQTVIIFLGSYDCYFIDITYERFVVNMLEYSNLNFVLEYLS